MTSQSFDIERIWCRLFQKRIARTKFDIFEFVLLVYQLFQERVVRTKFDILEFVFIGISVIPETRRAH